MVTLEVVKNRGHPLKPLRSLNAISSRAIAMNGLTSQMPRPVKLRKSVAPANVPQSIESVDPPHPNHSEPASTLNNSNSSQPASAPKKVVLRKRVIPAANPSGNRDPALFAAVQAWEGKVRSSGILSSNSNNSSSNSSGTHSNSATLAKSRMRRQFPEGLSLLESAMQDGSDDRAWEQLDQALREKMANLHSQIAHLPELPKESKELAQPQPQFGSIAKYEWSLLGHSKPLNSMNGNSRNQSNGTHMDTTGDNKRSPPVQMNGNGNHHNSNNSSSSNSSSFDMSNANGFHSSFKWAVSSSTATTQQYQLCSSG